MRGIAVATLGVFLLVVLVMASMAESAALCTESTWCH